MSRVPESVDELMWLVAEQNEPAAIEAFDRRYPEFRKEMMARLEMVRGFRAARPEPARSIPVFQPTIRATRTWGLPRWALAGAASVLFFGIGFASYKVIEGSKSVAQTSVVTTMPVAVQTPVTTPFKEVAGTRDSALSLAPETGNPAARNNGTDHLKPRDLLEEPTPAEMEVVVRSNKMTLAQALREVAAQSGLDLVIGPGLPDDLISVDLSGPAMKVLGEMAQTYGFTVYDQHDGTVNIVPAVDPKAVPADDSGDKSGPVPTNEH